MSIRIKCSKTLNHYIKNIRGRITNVDTFERYATESEIKELKESGYRIRKVKNINKNDYWYNC